MPTLPNMGLITPVLGEDIGTWDDKINAMFALVDAHDHTSGKGLAITTDALDIDADLSLVGFGLTDAGLVDFTPVTPLTTGAVTLFVSSADNELYWRNASGTNVKLTLASSINTSLVGGIVGDYSSVGAQVAYEDANKRYTFKTQTATWARLASGPVRIFEYNTTESVYAELAVAAGLAAPYTVTFPAALGTSTAAPMLIDASGNVTFGGSMVLDLDANITLSGTGVIKHGTKTVPMALEATRANITTGTVSTTGGSPGVVLGNNTTAYWQLPVLPPGARLKGIAVWFPDTTSRTDCTCALFQTSSADPALRAFTSTGVTIGTSSGTAKKIATTSLTPSGSQTYWLQISNSATTPAISAVSVDFDIP